jgi:predicted CoA-binding protein
MGTEEKILNDYKVIAVVGLSSNPQRPSNRVALYMKNKGYKIIPVNPNEKEILGETCYPDLNSIPEAVEVVDIFRKSEDVLPIVEEACRCGAKAIWMQEGVINQAASEFAGKAGLEVVMDRCMLKEHQKLNR